MHAISPRLSLMAAPVAVQDLRPGISSPQRRLGRLSNSGWTRKQNPSPSDFYIRTMKQKGSFLSQHNGKSDIVKQYRCAEKILFLLLSVTAQPELSRLTLLTVPFHMQPAERLLFLRPPTHSSTHSVSVR